MLSINSSDIVLSQAAENKQQAIQSIANSLVEKTYVEAAYLDGMLAREAQNSTFLGNGIAIPHGTTETRDKVKQTGVIVHHFPQGVDWGNDNTVYLAIGIAAQSDQHLAILKQLTKVLSAEGIEQQLKEASTAQGIVSLLNGEMQSETLFNADLIQLNFPASDLLQLTAVAAGLIKNQGAVQSSFIADVIAKQASYLGQGLWLNSSSTGISKTAVSFVSASESFQLQGKPVQGLLCIASNSQLHLKNLNILIDLIHKQQIEQLFDASEEQVITLLTQEKLEGSQQIFTIKNPHGLHARPGAMLVHVAKKFKAKIQMTNLNGTGKSANAKSLMKVMTQGVQFGHQLQFVAQGEDAEEALHAIGQAINEGLGEAIA
ncbi:fused PTS fructose transporter subunit IIA/HPr protein [Psychromonas ossibalaenae]|uniref:fused PTS fructose transporter subunit IIA/HPr protein n=1 Tax=Psychromonas ossibalaenae TaxID=444922 RepID=UPI00037CA66F|nr:fused PTS fructose transporter subunit IIA/HPr protein [Psychromonas ossibalaenae]